MKAKIKRIIAYSFSIVIFLYLVFSTWIYIDVRKSLDIAFNSDGIYKEHYSTIINKDIYARINPRYSRSSKIKYCIGSGVPIHYFLGGTIHIKCIITGIPEVQKSFKGPLERLVQVEFVLRKGTWKIEDITL